MSNVRAAEVPILGALGRWRADLRAGVGGQRADVPATWRLDAIYRAACWEASALQCHADGFHATAEQELRRARELWSTVGGEHDPPPVAPHLIVPSRPMRGGWPTAARSGRWA
ncbi:MAG: hypothetical protein H0T86_13205 [Gemmatimonadales bacterium]|nr:hypothetical protein [Gemmatimonadales bacterium]